MDNAQRLLAVESIKQLKARYFRCMDTKDWAGFEALFAADAVFDLRSGSGAGDKPGDVRRGAANIVEFVRSSIGDVTTVHHGHMPEIDLLTETTARGTWAMEDVLIVPAGSSLPFKRLKGYGHYHEAYVCADGHWKIQTLRLTRLHVETN